MRRVLSVAAMCVASLVMAGCGSDPNAESPTESAAQTEPVASPEALKSAVYDVLLVDCWNCMNSPEYRAQEKVLRDAGPAVVPLLTEMVADKELTAWFVGRMAHLASQHPLSEAFRQALRARRDDPDFVIDPDASFRVSIYFASYGDATDLAWMQGVADSLDEIDRISFDDPIAKLRQRLGK